MRGLTPDTGGGIKDSVVSGVIGGTFGVFGGKVAGPIITKVSERLGNAFLAFAWRASANGLVSLFSNQIEQQIDTWRGKQPIINEDKASIAFAMAFIASGVSDIYKLRLDSEKTKDLLDTIIPIASSAIGIATNDLIDGIHRLGDTIENRQTVH